MRAISVYPSTFWYFLWKGNAPLQNWVCVLLSLRLHHSIYLLCRSDSLWEERPCCQWSPVKLRGFLIPASGTMRLAAKTEAAFLEIPWFNQSQASTSKDLANPHSTLWWLSSKLRMEDPMHQCHSSLGKTQWPERRAKRHPRLNMGF